MGLWLLLTRRRSWSHQGFESADRGRFL